jgi:hypothetical protein
MRRALAALTAVVIVTCATGAAEAQLTPEVTAEPKRVGAGAIQTVTGRRWPVIEFCSRTIRVLVRSAQNAVTIAQRRVGERGVFRFRWIPRNKNVGPGRWRLVARMRCESGEDGSPVVLRRSVLIRVLP